MSIRLIRFADSPRADEIIVAGATVTIGRVASNDIALDDARISSRHGRLVRRGEGYLYEDLGSRNGSMLERDGERDVVPAHQSRRVQTGDRLLLGDFVTPVVVAIEHVPTAAADDAGETVLARRAVADGAAALDRAVDPEALRGLFRLLHVLSGQTDGFEMLRRIADATLERFPHARAVTVWAARDSTFEIEFTRLREEGGDIRPPSRTLLARALERREVVAYSPGHRPGETTSASVYGLAGAALVPLFAGDVVSGVLHVDSTQRSFGDADLAWLAIVGTHVAACLATARRFREVMHSAEALREENRALRRTVDLGRPILGHSDALKASLHQLERVARTDATVLIMGETGTGKELAARFVHAHSRRADGPLAPLNCAALPETLLESELFGHRKGAFTGATRDRKGLFEAACGGTIFLDEIGEISPAVQVRLLRVLQEREVQPVGATRTVRVDVRIVAATNRDLQTEVAQGRFREDLYYRLAVFPVALPPLRERKGDVDLLAERFREAAAARHGVASPGFTTEALHALSRFDWPGNVRQLEHEVERAVIMSGDGQPISLEDLSPAISGGPTLDSSGVELPTGRLKEVMEVLERRVIERCLDEHAQNRTRAAKGLGISRQALQAKLARWKLHDEASGMP